MFAGKCSNRIGMAIGMTPPKTNMDTENAPFEKGIASAQAPNFGGSMWVFRGVAVTSPTPWKRRDSKNHGPLTRSVDPPTSSCHPDGDGRTPEVFKRCRSLKRCLLTEGNREFHGKKRHGCSFCKKKHRRHIKITGWYQVDIRFLQENNTTQVWFFAGKATPPWEWRSGKKKPSRLAIRSLEKDTTREAILPCLPISSWMRCANQQKTT